MKNTWVFMILAALCSSHSSVTSFTTSSRTSFVQPKVGTVSPSISSLVIHRMGNVNEGGVNGKIISKELNGNSPLEQKDFSSSSEQNQIVSETSSSSSDSSTKENENENIPSNQIAKRRKMELSWCGRDACTIFEDGLREKVVGDHNEILFDSPATGQVAYQWINGNDINEGNVTLSRVLILVKKNDDELLEAASEVSC